MVRCKDIQGESFHLQTCRYGDYWNIERADAFAAPDANARILYRHVYTDVQDQAASPLVTELQIIIHLYDTVTLKVCLVLCIYSP